ncbi:MAG: hypothetical protein KF802_07560 [Bdellovibrionaceae bacterium]|nr:hypothetical protein [Pseudobdellovibrionaceae bacterium]MBX3032971.1 hypothetical protein [Pseudobdellovibrionaceae bacterium]
MLKFFIAICVLRLSSVVYASPQEPGLVRQERISVGAATSAERQLQIYERILNLAGRKIFDIKIKAQNGFGHIMEVTFSTSGTRPTECDYEVQEIGIGYFQNLTLKIERTLDLQRTDRNKIVDVEISSTFGTGKIAAVKLSICK